MPCGDVLFPFCLKGTHSCRIQPSGRSENDEFVFLAGDRYRKNLVPHMKNYSVPMKGLGIGKQLKYLKGATQDE